MDVKRRIIVEFCPRNFLLSMSVPPVGDGEASSTRWANAFLTNPMRRVWTSSKHHRSFNSITNESMDYLFDKRCLFLQKVILLFLSASFSWAFCWWCILAKSFFKNAIWIVVSTISWTTSALYYSSWNHSWLGKIFKYKKS